MPRLILWLPKDLASTWPGLTPGPQTVGSAAFWGGWICAGTTRNKEGASFTHMGDTLSCWLPSPMPTLGTQRGTGSPACPWGSWGAQYTPIKPSLRPMQAGGPGTFLGVELQSEAWTWSQ